MPFRMQKTLDTAKTLRKGFQNNHGRLGVLWRYNDTSSAEPQTTQGLQKNEWLSS